MRKRRYAASRGWLLLAVATLLVPLLVGCTHRSKDRVVIPPLAGTEPNGEQNRSAAELIDDARVALTRAVGTTLNGELVLGGVTLQASLTVAADLGVSGILATASGSLQVQTDGSTAYLRGTGQVRSVVRALGLPEALARSAPGGQFWQLDVAASGPMQQLLPRQLPALLLPPTLRPQGDLTASDVDGTPIVTAGTADGERVSVAVTGRVRLVQITGGVGGHGLVLQPLTVPPATPHPVPAATPAPVG